MTTLVKKVRESNLELYRIIVMLLIVSHHYVVNSGLFEQLAADRLAANAVFFYLFGMWGKIGINCFVLITGYFMCTSRITLQKFLKLLLQVLFYVFVFYLLFCIIGYQEFSLTHFIYTMNPIKTVGNGFTSCYLLFFLFIPFLNILVKHMGERWHRLLAVLLFVTYTLTSSIPYIHVTMNYVTWFCVLYIYASYIRLYASDKFSTRFWGWASVGSIALSMLSVYVCLWFGKEDVYPLAELI